MGTQLEKLLSIGSPAFSHEDAQIAPESLLITGKLGQELQELLSHKNGFFSFESSLRVFSTYKTKYSHSLSTWNSPELWRNQYGTLTNENDSLCFAEDIFGCQFCIKNEVIFLFDPETGNLEEMSNSLEDWASKILSDYEIWTGCPLAKQWQEKFGKLPYYDRLIPKIPFVCGGAFQVDNLYGMDAVKGMRTRSNLAHQIAMVEDGEQITFNIIE